MSRDHQLIAKLSSLPYERYDDMQVRARTGKSLGYNSNLEIGILMMQEYTKRLESKEMKYHIFWLNAKKFIYFSNFIHSLYLMRLKNNNIILFHKKIKASQKVF